MENLKAETRRMGSSGWHKALGPAFVLDADWPRRRRKKARQLVRAARMRGLFCGE